MTKNIILIIVAFQLSGCATGQWYKAGATQQEFQEVNYMCLKESQQHATQASSSFEGRSLDGSYYQHIGAAAVTPKVYGGGYSHEGYALGGSKADFSSNYSSEMITNEKLFKACMNAYGFYWVIMDNNY